MRVRVFSRGTGMHNKSIDFGFCHAVRAGRWTCGLDGNRTNTNPLPHTVIFSAVSRFVGCH